MVEDGAFSHKSYGDFAEWVDFAYWWSFIGKGLRLQPAQQACLLYRSVDFKRESHYTQKNVVCLLFGWFAAYCLDKLDSCSGTVGNFCVVLSVILESRAVSVECAMCCVQCVVCSLQCVVYSGLCVVCNVLCRSPFIKSDIQNLPYLDWTIKLFFIFYFLS